MTILIGCSVKKADFKALQTEVKTTGEKVLILEEQIKTLDHAGSYQLNEHITALNTRINALENRGVTPVEPVNFTPVEQIPGSIVDDQINALYNQARRQYQNRDFHNAIRTFTSVANQAPAHELAANSFYWIGESYYGLADYSAARENFQIVQDRYPNSSKFIDAQVKIAMTWIRQGRRDLARGILEAIRRDFPNYERMNVVDQQLRLVRG
jgi:tol-pal system protein YbgF